jgi:hypothetical protein
VRTAISEVIVRRDDAIIHAVLHWQGGDHTELQVKQRLNAAGRHNPRIPDDTIALMRELARLMPARTTAGARWLRMAAMSPPYIPNGMIDTGCGDGHRVTGDSTEKAVLRH